MTFFYACLPASLPFTAKQWRINGPIVKSHAHAHKHTNKKGAILNDEHIETY